MLMRKLLAHFNFLIIFPSLSVTLLLILTGCSEIVPIEGPTSGAIEANNGPHKYQTFSVDPFVVDATTFNPIPYFIRAMGGNAPSRSPRLGPGDIITVIVWESGSSQLFSTSGGPGSNSVTKLEKLTIDRNGRVFIPYAGRIRVAGRTTEGARRLIQARLSRETLRPQVQLSLISDEKHRVTITGIVNKPGNYSLGLADGSGTLIELLAEAGGLAKQSAPYKARVTLIRGRKKGHIKLSDLFAHPDQNINLQARDKIIVEQVPDTYSLLGAVKVKGQYEFKKAHVYLVDALAHGRGLDDIRSQATGVFIFRFERPDIVNRIRKQQGLPVLDTRSLVPVVYKINFADPASIFFAKKFRMRNEDTVFVTNAPLYQWDKVIQVASRTAFLISSGKTLATPIP